MLGVLNIKRSNVAIILGLMVVVGAVVLFGFLVPENDQVSSDSQVESIANEEVSHEIWVDCTQEPWRFPVGKLTIKMGEQGGFSKFFVEIYGEIPKGCPPLTVLEWELKLPLN